VLQREFAHVDSSYYAAAIQCGLVSVNGCDAEPDTLVQAGDVITHSLHRHEPPVTAQPLTVVHEDDAVLAINKPPSIAVHACQKHSTKKCTAQRQHDSHLYRHHLHTAITTTPPSPPHRHHHHTATTKLHSFFPPSSTNGGLLPLHRCCHSFLRCGQVGSTGTTPCWES
jgi:23S rRNA-/tRNA-specific pseudouridylate synthase